MPSLHPPVGLRRTLLRGAAALAASCTLGAAAQSAYPNRPIRWIVPWPVGTPADVSGRIVAEKMAQGLGQAIVVENRPGAAGTIGLAEALRQAPDGHTVYMLSSASLVAPLLFSAQQGLSFSQALEPVGMVVWSYNLLVTPTQSPFTGAADIVAAGRPGARAEALSFPSGGNGTPAHLAGELFKQQTGVVATHVPYNQFGAAIADLISGRTQFMFLTASAAIPQVQGGKLRALASTGAQRLPALKELPTMVEQGFKDFVLRSFDALMVRPGTPREVIERLNTELNKALAAPEVRERLLGLALEPEAMTPRQMATTLAAEQDKWQRLGRTAQIKAD